MRATLLVIAVATGLYILWPASEVSPPPPPPPAPEPPAVDDREAPEDVVGIVVDGHLPPVEDILTRAARPEEHDVRLRTFWSLRQARLSRAEFDALLPLAASDHLPVRLWTLRLLERRWDLDPELQAPLLGVCRAAAADADGKCREYACRVVAGAPEEQAMPLLTALVGDAEWNVRAAAARALRDYPCAKTLLKTLSSDDPDPRVREVATEPSLPDPR